MVRQSINEQMLFGEVDVSKVVIDEKSRDDIPQVLLGLQQVYQDTQAREKIFSLLEKEISTTRSLSNGRPGMDLWRILVLGTLRLTINCDYDRIVELANNHSTLREMLGHGMFNNSKYALQTVKDNVGLLTAEILIEINTIIVELGHKLCKKKSDKVFAKCDSFVLETNVHYPTDLGLLFDSTRKAIQLTAKICETLGLSNFRQSKYNIRSVKRSMRELQKLRRSKSRDEKNASKRAIEIEDQCNSYLDICQQNIARVREVKCFAIENNIEKAQLFSEIDRFTDHADRFIDQIRRRIIHGESIPHEEKVFSVFEEHTEWISKGKAGVPVELGLRVAIVEDQFGFILHHKVLQNETDDKIAVPIIRETKKHFPALEGCSFDKGFHSPENQKELLNLLNMVVLPKKGKLSKMQREVEQSDDFRQKRHQHSAVESGINALEVHGLDRCPDKGLDHFKLYTAIAITARNLQKIGALVQKSKRKAANRLERTG